MIIHFIEFHIILKILTKNNNNNYKNLVDSIILGRKKKKHIGDLSLLHHRHRSTTSKTHIDSSSITLKG
jgi:hypothetical protein